MGPRPGACRGLRPHRLDCPGSTGCPSGPTRGGCRSEHRRSDRRSSTEPTGGISPIGPSLPLSRMRAGISGAASASVDPTRLGASLLLPASVGLMTGLADVAVDLPAGVEALLLFGGQRRDRRGRARLAGPLDRAPARWPRARRDRHPPPPIAESAAGSRFSRTVALPPPRPARRRRGAVRERIAPPGPARPPGQVGHGAFAAGGAASTRAGARASAR